MQEYMTCIYLLSFRYIQVGNAVAVPVARALGYSLAMAFKGQSGTEPLLILPERFPEASVPVNQTSSV